MRCADYGITRFQSTPPVKAATKSAMFPTADSGISIHAAREGGDKAIQRLHMDGGISIHAAREGGDGGGCAVVCVADISIHAAREGGDVYQDDVS